MTLGTEVHTNIRHQAPVLAFPESDFVIPTGMSCEQFKAMGTTITLLLPKQQKAEGSIIVRELFEEWEQALSRFRPTSELSQLNELAGKQVIVSTLLLNVLTAALAAAQATNGIYDPTLLNQLTQIGYDRSFDALPPKISDNMYRGAEGGEWRKIQVDRAIRCVALPYGVQLDFGGIAKGMAVDAALERLRLSGFEIALVNAGGDLRVYGVPPGADHWSIAIPGKEAYWVIPLRHGAIATSGRARRQWKQGNISRHHLLDPRTGLPVDNGLWSVTVAAADCMQAEVAAKVAFILGSMKGKHFLYKHQLAGLFVNIDGKWEIGDNWPGHLMRRYP